jgi:hypothetical protein
MSKTTTCTYHCSACGLHFHSLVSFNAHRTGSYASNDPEEGRRCLHPLDLDGRLVKLTEGGECRMYEDAAQPGSGIGLKRRVTIWTEEGRLTRIRERYGSERSPRAEMALCEQGSEP